jgi:hypothetical protein
MNLFGLEMTMKTALVRTMKRADQKEVGIWEKSYLYERVTLTTKQMQLQMATRSMMMKKKKSEKN